MTRIRMAALAAAVAWFGATPAAAQPQKKQDLKATAAKIADEVKALAEGKDQTSVRLGNFVPVGPVFDGGDGAPSLELELRSAFGGFVNQKSVLELRGEMRYTEVKNVRGKVIQIKALLENLNTTKILKEIEVPILFVDDITRFTGPSGSIEGGGFAGDAREELAKLLDNPTAKAAGTLATPRAGSPYQVEIRAKKNGAAGNPVARPVTVTDGMPFVKIDAGEVYEVRVLNHSPQEAAFRLSVDGIDQFAFTDDRTNGEPRYEHYLLPPAKGGKPGETVVYGWYKTFDDVRNKHQYFEFLTTEFGKGNILNKPKSKVGMVKLSFSLSFENSKDAKTRGKDVETSKGKLGETDGSVVKRFINPPEEFLTIRYNREIK